ncbi:MAG TPA: beta-galactosidase [Planctomycetota bacterium]|nr:beta-galactosidase [Planctomycetota bacterium]
MHRRSWILHFLLPVLAAGRAVPAEAPARIARTLAALDDLERACQQAEKAGMQGIYLRIPLVVERHVLVDLEPGNKDRDVILDHIYHSSLRAKAAILDGAEARRPHVPPPPDLAKVSFRDGWCHEGDALVFPLVAGSCPKAVKPFFAEGELRRLVPALGGPTGEALDQTALARLYRDDPTSRRVGWDRPAGGFARDGTLICLDHPGVPQAIADCTAKAVAAWPKGGRPLYVSLGSEPFYTDYSDLSRDRFLAWLREHYKSVRLLNAAWGTEAADFAPGLLPTPDEAAASPSRWTDFADFNHGRLTDHIRWAAGNVRAAAPGVPVGIAPLRYAFAGSFALSGVDPVALAAALDVFEVSGGSVIEADLAFALAAGKRPVVNPTLSASFDLIPQQLHGVAAARLAAWPPGPLTSIEAIRVAEALLRDALDARRLAPQCARLAQAPKPIALLYSQASLRLAPQWALRCSKSPYTHELARAWQAARFLDLGVTFLTSRDVADARWQGTRLLIVPAAPAEEEAVVRALSDFVELGGHLLLIAESFVSDERGREADHLMRLGIEAPETRRPSYSTKARPDLGGALDDLVASDSPVADLRPAPDGPLASVKRPLRATGLSQRIKINVAHKVLATFADGTPAIATFGRGKGALTYLAAPLETEDLALVLRLVAARAGIEPLVRLVPLEGAASGIECRSARDGPVVLAYAWNTSAEARRVAFETGPITAALNLATGRPVATQTDKAGALLGPLRLAPGEVALLQLTPTRPAPPGAR